MVLSERPVHLTTRPHLREGNHPARNSLTMSATAGKSAGEQGTGKRQTARVRKIRQQKLGTLWSQQQPGRESPRGTSVRLLAGQSAASMAAPLCWSSWPALVLTRTMALSSSVLLAFSEPDTWKAEGSAPGACPRGLSVRRGACDENGAVYFWQEIREVRLCVSRETRRGLRSESYCWLVNMDHWDGCCWPHLSLVRPLFLVVILMANKRPSKPSVSEALEPMNLIT